ncbi:hypothetical protein D3C75_158760 [compost metagenome]
MTDTPLLCTIKGADIAVEYDEFITFGYNDHTGEVECVSHADALTLLKALVKLQQLTTEAYSKLSPEMKEEIGELVWGGAKPSVDNS